MGQPSNLGLVPGPHPHKKVILVVDFAPFQRTEVMYEPLFRHVVSPQAIRDVIHGCYRRKVEAMAALLAGWFKEAVTCFGLLLQGWVPRDVDGGKTGWRSRATRSRIGRIHCDEFLEAEGGLWTYLVGMGLVSSAAASYYHTAGQQRGVGRSTWTGRRQMLVGFHLFHAQCPTGPVTLLA